MVIACVGGGSNAMGAFYEFIDEKDVKLVGLRGSRTGCGDRADRSYHSNRPSGHFSTA